MTDFNYDAPAEFYGWRGQAGWRAKACDGGLLPTAASPPPQKLFVMR